MLLEAKHLGREVNSKVLLQDINFSVATAEIIAIIGPSGSGKSSLLRLLNRLDEPTSGTVYFEGKDYRQMPPRDLRCKIGMVTQRAYLFPGTVAENINFGPAQRGILLEREKLEKLLSQVSLAGFADRNVANLSGGEAQRVSVARTLANNPEILLLDEPTSALDETAKSDVEALLQSIMRERSLTCILVTHDEAQAKRLAQRALILQAGRIVKESSIKEVWRA